MQDKRFPSAKSSDPVAKAAVTALPKRFAAVLVALAIAAVPILPSCSGGSPSDRQSSAASASSSSSGSSGDKIVVLGAEIDEGRDGDTPLDAEIIRSDRADLEGGTVARVVDGDTLVVALSSGQEKVRLIGIDAPESVHPDDSRNTSEGEEASAYLKALLPAGTTVYLQKDVSDRDRYGRLLRYVWLEQPDDIDDPDEIASKMLNAVIVSSGHAVAKEYEPDTRYCRILESLQAG